jgi:hypothetical protein
MVYELRPDDGKTLHCNRDILLRADNESDLPMDAKTQYRSNDGIS